VVALEAPRVFNPSAERGALLEAALVLACMGIAEEHALTLADILIETERHRPGRGLLSWSLPTLPVYEGVKW